MPSEEGHAGMRWGGGRRGAAAAAAANANANANAMCCGVFRRVTARVTNGASVLFYSVYVSSWSEMNVRVCGWGKPYVVQKVMRTLSTGIQNKMN